jgi:hypothetical protein
MLSSWSMHTDTTAERLCRAKATLGREYMQVEPQNTFTPGLHESRSWTQNRLVGRKYAGGTTLNVESPDAASHDGKVELANVALLIPAETLKWE